MMRKIFVLTMIGFTLLAACYRGKGFTQAERQIIGKSLKGGVMRIWQSDDPADLPLLRAEAAPMTQQEVKSPYFKVLKQRMIATVTDPSNEGVGIAAPQVGISRMMIAVQRFDREGELFEFYINPSIDWYSDTKANGQEGCLSVAGIQGNVSRADSIIVSYDDPNNLDNRIIERVTGFTAVIFQHEIDHLHGKLFTDYLTKEEEQN